MFQLTELYAFCTIRAVELELALTPSRDACALRLPFPRFAAISLRGAGDMGGSTADSTPERTRFLNSFGIDVARCHTNRQVHSRDIVVVSGSSRELVTEDGRAVPIAAGHQAQADGTVFIASGSGVSQSADGSLAIAVTVADCLPLFLYDHRTGNAALLHSGWKGTGILEAALDLLGERGGSAPSNVELLIGPGIGPCCYRVSDERARAFSERFGEECVRQEGGGEPTLDLPRANLEIARRRGVGCVTRLASCTQCSRSYHSYRREGPERYGHMLALCTAA